ncbi:cysteine-rich protein 2 isoform X2 [Myotis myotis]|uniref:cysteine-rich protein 2 isoform X2 n=1 Tax=Myotis myotis TaxID=51298 RepID=UPI00174C269E|nr:cysteine-rich protein 2 isoform X2 [Myotis myotis]
MVRPAEKVSSLGKDWHKFCLKCERCSKTLTPGGHAEHDGKPFCHKPCYATLFGPKGVNIGGAGSYIYEKPAVEGPQVTGPIEVPVARAEERKASGPPKGPSKASSVTTFTGEPNMCPRCNKRVYFARWPALLPQALLRNPLRTQGSEHWSCGQLHLRQGPRGQSPALGSCLPRAHCWAPGGPCPAAQSCLSWSGPKSGACVLGEEDAHGLLQKRPPPMSLEAPACARTATPLCVLGPPCLCDPRVFMSVSWPRVSPRAWASLTLPLLLPTPPTVIYHPWPGGHTTPRVSPDGPSAVSHAPPRHRPPPSRGSHATQTFAQ